MLPDDYTQCSGSNSNYPYEIDNNGTVFVSKSDRYQNLSKDSEVVIANTNNWLVSKNSGEKVIFGQKPTTFNSNVGYLCAELKCSLSIQVASQSDGYNKSHEVILNKEDETHTIKDNDEAVIDIQQPIEYISDSRNKEFYNPDIKFKIENKGETKFISHPKKKGIPARSRSGLSAEKGYIEAQQRNGSISDSRSRLNIDRNSKLDLYLLNSDVNMDKIENVPLIHEKKDPKVLEEKGDE